MSQYSKLFSRDFSLPSVEVWVKGESVNSKGWTVERQPFLPYIITERSDDTVHFYYDLDGVVWVQDLLVKIAREDKEFIPRIEKTVLDRLTFIKPIYEKEKIIGRSDLIKFMDELEKGYPWFEAMWWFFQMDDESKVEGLDLENLAKVRGMTDKLCNSSDSVIRKSLAKIYPELGDLSALLTTSEVKLDKLPPENELEKRGKGYFFTAGELYTNVDKHYLERKFGILFEENILGSKERCLSGMTAYKGVVRGFVRRVMGHSQIAAVKEGEILISPMTIADFVPAIIKAAAIVTDEGGMLSHAAIVAREFRKPTVVGTTMATKRLKDGDIVEVDADKGKVTLICHASIVANTYKKPCIVGTRFATDLFKDGDYVEVDADAGTITLLNKKDKYQDKKNIEWKTLFK